MSEHEWVQQNLASYSAEGLEPEERDRIDAHLAQCAECRMAREEQRGFDQKLGSLFAPARPTPAIEDRMIQSLRTKSQRRWRPHWTVSTAAAVILLGCVGMLAENIMRVGIPEFIATHNNLFQGGLGQQTAGGEAPDAYYSNPFAFNLSESADSSEVKALASEELKIRDQPSDANTKWTGAYKQQQRAGEATDKTSLHLKDVDQLAKEEAEKNPAELLNSAGYYPPSRALVVKGSSRIHSNLGGPTSAPLQTDLAAKDRPAGASETQVAREGKERDGKLAFRPFGFINQFDSRDYHKEVDRRPSGEALVRREAEAPSQRVETSAKASTDDKALNDAYQRWMTQQNLWGSGQAATSDVERRKAEQTYLELLSRKRANSTSAAQTAGQQPAKTETTKSDKGESESKSSPQTTAASSRKIIRSARSNSRFNLSIQP